MEQLLDALPVIAGKKRRDKVTTREAMQTRGMIVAAVVPT